MPGLSGLSLFVPKARVPLEAWCGWTGASPDKVKAVVGDAFRVATGADDVYTLAANAVVRLIERYEVDPSRVGYLVFATESSTDNAVGGPTVRGLVDAALAARGQRLPREIETFEMKQACLSGMNGLLAATRFVTLEPEQVAIVVAGDIAEYARGSSGEQTQGAGAVAMLVESEARLLEIDPREVGRSSDDRVRDFRKPVRGGPATELGWSAARPPDFPRFAGSYSTQCYLEAVDRAFVHLARRTGASFGSLLDEAALMLLHRPYEKMPQTSVARMFLRKLVDDKQADLLEATAARAEVKLDAALAELDAEIDLGGFVAEHGVQADPIPALAPLVRGLSKTPEGREFAESKGRFGRKVVRELGNLYSASLPAWIGAGLEQAAQERLDLTGRHVLLFGYGSGDSSLAIRARLAPGWSEAAARLGFGAALEGAVDIERDTYERAHDRVTPVELAASGSVVLERVGTGPEDKGVPYYAYRA